MKNISTFAPANRVSRSKKSAGCSSNRLKFINDNTPPMPLQVRLNAHLGGLFF